MSAHAPTITRADGTSPDLDDRIADIRRSLELLHDPGDVFEVRALGVPSGKWENTVSGYYDDVAKAARDIAMLDARRRPRGIYTTINPCNPSLLARANNRLIERPKHTTSDTEIIRRRWLPYDIDPIRPAGIAATQAEVDAALALAADVEDMLRGQGWPLPLIAASGNGCYLLYRIDMPNDARSLETITRCYAAANHMLASHYGPARPLAEIDTTVSNAGRILRIGGTWNRKGDPTPDRPHRMCVYHEPDPDQPIEVLS